MEELIVNEDDMNLPWYETSANYEAKLCGIRLFYSKMVGQNTANK